MTQSERDDLLRQYAAADITWSQLRAGNFENYVEVLEGLGKLGLRPPIAAMNGPNVAARERGIELIRRSLKARR